MRFFVDCAHQETGSAVVLSVDAPSADMAADWAISVGYLVHKVRADTHADRPRPANWSVVGQIRRTTEQRLSDVALLVRHATHGLLGLWVAWMLIAVLSWLAIGARVSELGSALAVPSGNMLRNAPTGGQTFRLFESLLVVLTPVTMLATWVTPPVVVFVLGRSLEMHLRGQADLVRLGKRSIGLPYAPRILGCE